MISFLYEQYGYYPQSFNEGVFSLKGWYFKLVEVEWDEIQLDKIEQYSQIIRNNFNNKGPYLIKNRNNKTISYYDNKKYILISIKEGNFTIENLNKFHVIFNQLETSVDLSEILKMWQVRTYEIEKNGVSSLRVDSSFYSANLEIVMFCLGLGHNAIQYLSDIIYYYGNELKGLSLTHKRIDNLDNINFYNPFNYIIDHPIRDLVEMYRNDLINIEDLISLLDFYKMDSILASLFIARLLYPVNVWDRLEENIELKNKEFKIKYSIEKELQKIKNIYLFFKEKYNICPINWLEL